MGTLVNTKREFAEKEAGAQTCTRPVVTMQREQCAVRVFCFAEKGNSVALLPYQWKCVTLKEDIHVIY
jgi:hypothetical protein